MQKNRVLVIDIETSPLLAYVWSLKEQYIPPKQIKEDWHIMLWSAKWLGEPKSLVTYAAKNGDDRSILKPLWKLLNEADTVITQNGKEFDAKKINARFMLQGFKPPKPYTHLDTYQIVKRVAGFTSNRLEYLTDKFCKTHKKTSHSKFAGISLWIECLKGNKKAWKEMKHYNIKDVLSTEELYLKIQSWAPESAPKVFELTDTESACGTCGYEGRMRQGRPRRAKLYWYRQNSCPKCGTWQTGAKLKEKPSGR